MYGRLQNLCNLHASIREWFSRLTRASRGNVNYQRRKPQAKPQELTSRTKDDHNSNYTADCVAVRACSWARLQLVDRVQDQEKMVYCNYTKQRMLSLHWQGYTVSKIVECLVLEDQIRSSKQGVRQFLKRYHQTNSIARKPGSGLPPKHNRSLKMQCKLMMRQQQLNYRHCWNQGISMYPLLPFRSELGWTYRGSAYCQLIRQVNKDKRLQWARTYNFDNVVWTDETTVQLETHKRYCYRKEGEQPRPKPRAKHPVKVHVWAGISKEGATEVCVFEG